MSASGNEDVLALLLQRRKKRIGVSWIWF